MIRRPVRHALLGVLFLAACETAPATPALTDPVEILVRSVEAARDARSVTVDLVVRGSLPVDLGGGSPQPVPLDGSTAAADIDLATGDLRATFAVSGVLDLVGELIQADGVAYLRSTMTGPRYERLGGGGLPLDPRVLGEVDPEGLRELLEATGVAPALAESVDCAPGRCYAVVVALTPEALAALAPGGLPTAGLPVDLAGSAITATVLVDHATLRPAELDLAIDGGDEPTVLDVGFSAWDEPVVIEPPPADQVAPAP